MNDHIGQIAALPMYDRPETAAANDALWDEIRARLGHGPAALTRRGDLWDIWQSPRLLLSQTCGLPYRSRLHGRVTLVGTPDYGLADTPPGYYRSIFVTRPALADLPLTAFANRPFAVNEIRSQSGWAGPQAHAAGLGFAFTAPVISGAHIMSGRWVAEGRADLAAIDAVSWALMRRHDGFAAGLREIGRTAPTPGLPLITAPGRDPAPLFAAVSAAIAALPAASRAILLLRGIVHIPARRYLKIPLAPPLGAK